MTQLPSTSSARASVWKTIIKKSNPQYLQAHRQKLAVWRKQNSCVRTEPSRIERAKATGYKDKPGFLVARVRVRKGHPFKQRPKSGRRPKRMGVRKITYAISDERIARNKAARRFSNADALGSYLAGEDGQYKWFEVVLKDRSVPV